MQEVRVDGEGRIGPLERVFYDTLIDENAASHIALGDGYEHPVDDPADRDRVNKSTVHVDFMIGSPELDVDGITHDGQTVPVLRNGAWQIRARLRGSCFRDLEQALAQIGSVLGEIVETW